MAALGDLLYRAALLWTRLAGNTTATKKFLTQTGTGAVSAAPAWGTIASGDLPSGTVTTSATLTAGKTIIGAGTSVVDVSTLTATVVKSATGTLSAAAAATDYVAPGAITTDGITMTTARLLGRTTATTGAVEEISVGSGLTLSAGSLTATGTGGTVTTTGSPASGNLTKFSGASSITNADLTGDVTTAGTVATTIANSAVTLAKIANAAANSKLVGSGSSGSGAAYSEITLGTGLSMSSTTLSATSSSGALILLNSHTAAASASIEFTDFSSTYSDYFLTFENVVAATDADSLILTLSDTGGYFSTNYQYIQVFTSTSSGPTRSASASAANIILFGSEDNSAPLHGFGYFVGTQQSTQYVTTKFFVQGFNNTVVFFNVDCAGVHALTSAITKCKFAMSSGGNITTGIFRLYGIAQ